MVTLHHLGRGSFTKIWAKYNSSPNFSAYNVLIPGSFFRLRLTFLRIESCKDVNFQRTGLANISIDMQCLHNLLLWFLGDRLCKMRETQNWDMLIYSLSLIASMYILSFPSIFCCSLPFSYLFSYSPFPPSLSPSLSPSLPHSPSLPPSLLLPLFPSLLLSLSLSLSLSPAWIGGSLVVNMAVRLANLTESQRDQIRRQIFREFCNVHGLLFALLITVWLYWHKNTQHHTMGHTRYGILAPGDIFCSSTALSDDKAQEVIDKALKESSIDIRNIVSVLTGLMGSGKTCLLSRIFNQPPPSVYTSTGVAEQSRRGWLHHMGSMSTSCSWQPFSHENVLEFLALNFYQRFVPGDRFHEGNTSPTGAAPLALPAPATAPSSPTSTPSTTSTSATAMLVQTAATTPTAGDYLSTQTAPQTAASMPALVAAQHASPNLSSGHFSSATSTAATLPASKDALSTPTGSPGLESSSAATPHLQTAAATIPAQKDTQPTQTADPILKSAPLSVPMSHLQTDTAMPDLKDGAFGFSHGSTCELSSHSYQCLAQPGMVPTGVAPIPLQASSTVALTPTSAAKAIPSSDAPSQTLASMPTPGASLSPQAASQSVTAMPLQTAGPKINSALPRTSMSSQASSQTAAIEKALPPSGMPHLQTAATRSPLTASSQISSTLPSSPPNPKAAATKLAANASLPTQMSAPNLNSAPSSVATPHLETAASLAPPIACRPPIASFKLAESSISRSVIKLVKAPKGSENPSRLDLAHFTDTGGQPEYMGSVPSLIHHCDLAMLTVNLKFDVDEYPPVHYHEKGRKYKRALPSQFSNRQIIQKLAMTLQAKRFAQREGQCFRLLVVATHRDCVPWHVRLSSRVRAYHKALTEIFLPACEKELIRCSADEIPFVLNLKEPDSTDLAKLDLIRQKVSDSGVGEVVKTPGAFFIFEQVLREFAEKSGHILSIEECLRIGEELKMGPDMVRSALIFFHRQITFLYYHHVMPNLVFTRPQIPLDCMNSIVHFKYKLESGELMGVTEELATSVRDGIITEEILSQEHFSKCFVPGLYGPCDAIDLLFHTFTLAPLSCEPQQKTGSSPAVQTKPSTPVKREKREYLMMCLRQAIPEKKVTQYIPVSSEIAPLVVQFTKNCVPLSCFGRTISCLLAMYDWELSRADNGSPKHLASNIVSLFDSQLPVEIILRDATSHLEVHVLPDRGFTPDRLSEVFVQIHETVFSAIKQVFDRMQLTGIEITPAFVCPCSKSFKHSHVASLHTLAGSSDGFLRCSKTRRNAGRVKRKQTVVGHTPPASLLPPAQPSSLSTSHPSTSHPSNPHPSTSPLSTSPLSTSHPSNPHPSTLRTKRRNS